MIAAAGANARKPRLVVLATHPIQYYAPLYRCLAERGRIDVKVLYLTDAGAVAHMDAGFAREVEWDVPLLTGYDFSILQPGTSITARAFWQRHDSRLPTLLEAERPDWLLLYGYASRMNWAAAWWARRRRVRVAYTSDSNVRDPQARRRVLLKKLVLGHYFGLVDAFLASSEANVEYLLKFGASRRKIHRIPFAIDFRRFRRPADEPFGRPRNYDFVWAGKFISLKRATDFVEALGLIARRIPRVIRACLVGDGPRREELEIGVSGLPPNCAVDMRGFVNQSGMPAALQAAEALVFTSEREPYGLIATEAAAAGLALVVADNIGCVGDSDLARPGVNALTYTIGDVAGLAAAMQRLMDDPVLRQRMQRASSEIAATHDFEFAAAAIERIVTSHACHA